MEEQELGVKEAIQRATNLITRDLYAGYTLSNLLLEEVDREGDTWYVTLGFSRPGRSEQSVLGALTLPQRVFKRVKVDAKTGRFLGMDDRQLVSQTSARME